MASMVIGSEVWAPVEGEIARGAAAHVGGVAPEGVPTAVNAQVMVSGLLGVVAKPWIEVTVTFTVCGEIGSVMFVKL